MKMRARRRTTAFVGERRGGAGNVEWMADGGWQMALGRMADGGWQMAMGLMADGGWQMAEETNGVPRFPRHPPSAIRHLILAILLFAATASAAPQDWVGPRVRIGDDPSWSSPTLDDSSWTLMEIEQVPQAKDALWMRWRIDLTNYKRAPGKPFGIYFAAMASHEIYWDGELLGRGGVVGRTKETEIAGPIEAHYHVPDRLATLAPHIVAIRASAFHRGFSPVRGYWALIVGNYDKLLAYQRGWADLAVIALSGIVLTAVFAFAMFWLARRDRSFLLLGTLCLTAAALLIAESWRPLFGYTYDWHIVRLRFIVALSAITGVQLVALVVTRFPHRLGRAVVIATTIACSVLPWIPRGWDPKSTYVFELTFVTATAWAAWSVWRRMHGSVLALVGVGSATVALFLQPWYWADYFLYFALNFVFVCLLSSHALEVRREQHQKARLELEMLRRHLQPHFLMNTLTALSEWIEEDPKTAVKMIESLSDELRILGAMSTRTLVSAAEELSLCRSHLANMSLRKDVAYSLEVEGVDVDRQVPPAMFHTLVENAITHAPAGAITLRLSARNDHHRTHYIFESPAGSEESGNGGGTKYIEARLREAWGERWTFQQGRAGAMWRTEIVVPS